MRAISVTALSSGQGKTLFTMGLIHWLKNNIGSVRPFKVGPDYIDTRFHEKIAGNSSINLDLYMMNKEEALKTVSFYSRDMDNLLMEGVMGFYDGIDYGTSTYDVAKAVNFPTVLVVSAEGSYATLVPIIKGIVDYRPDNTIKGVILNKVSSQTHYQMIEERINKEIPQLQVLGWIKKDIVSISSRHLGLDVNEIDNQKLDHISESVMKNINTSKLLELMEYSDKQEEVAFFCGISDKIQQACRDLTITVVKDSAFSFVYRQNLDFFHKLFGKVNIVSALNNEEVPYDSDIVYIPGGYVETPEFYPILQKADRFKQSLKQIALNKNKKIYAECAGLMFLGEKIATTDGNSLDGAGVLPIDFEMQNKRHRLGYYKALDKSNMDIYKGHAFHYSCPLPHDNTVEAWELYKDKNKKAELGAWTNNGGNVLGTYLHSFFFNQPELVLKYMSGGTNG